jgi:hypothetical protein
MGWVRCGVMWEIELQGHAIKNKDLLTASGAITLKGPERFEELEDDIRDVRPRPLYASKR